MPNCDTEGATMSPSTSIVRTSVSPWLPVYTRSGRGSWISEPTASCCLPGPGKELTTGAAGEADHEIGPSVGVEVAERGAGRRIHRCDHGRREPARAVAQEHRDPA